MPASVFIEVLLLSVLGSCLGATPRARLRKRLCPPATQECYNMTLQGGDKAVEG